uniref:Uncharacterized protein n=1 Tax=Branchiostoma floridae TaxID=7739 RepID=C3Z0A6_BRAFL|eukprot:XP_002597942.1 hypothetical protein BRAFLDRAFT_79816 [Branchiostoma floridae]
MWDLTMFLCVLWDLSAILCACPCSTCVPVFQEDLSAVYREDNIRLDRLDRSLGLAAIAVLDSSLQQTEEVPGQKRQFLPTVQSPGQERHPPHTTVQERHPPHTTVPWSGETSSPHYSPLVRRDILHTPKPLSVSCSKS